MFESRSNSRPVSIQSTRTSGDNAHQIAASLSAIRGLVREPKLVAQVFPWFLVDVRLLEGVLMARLGAISTYKNPGFAGFFLCPNA
jgi:hypothetical protein